MKCKWVQDRMLLYLADELERREAARVVSHLERCEVCTTTLEEFVESRDTLRDAVRTTAQPPASLDARILETVKALPRRRFPWPVRLSDWNTMRVLSLATGAALLLLVGFLWGRSSRPLLPANRTEVVSERPMLDLAALADSHLVWASNTEKHTPDKKILIERLSRQSGLRVTALEMKENALRLKDGAILQIKQVPVATLHYDWKGTPVTLAQADGMRLAQPTSLPEMRDHGRCFLIQHKGDLTTILWCEGTDNFVLMARVSPPQLFALACQFCAKLQKAEAAG